MRNGVRGLVGGLAATALAALLAGPAAAEMTLEAPDCVGNAGNVKTLQMKASGFMPGSLVSVRYEASYLGEPRSAALLTADATGTIKASLVPPPLLGRNRTSRRFTLSAVDPLRPETSVSKRMTVVHTRVQVTPRRATSSGRSVIYRAYGFEPGRTVFAHFKMRPRSRTVSLGRARGACGNVTKRMKLIPGRSTGPGSWNVFVDQRRRFSERTKPQARTSVVVQRPRARRR